MQTPTFDEFLDTPFADEPFLDADPIPADLPIDQKVYLCVKLEIHNPADICQKIAEPRPTVLQSLNRQTSAGKLKAYEQQNGQTGWRLAA